MSGTLTMLRRLASSDKRFKTVQFSDGLNIVVAEVTPTSIPTQSRNSTGKTSLIELIHFLLGSSVEKKASSVLGSPALTDHEFILSMDWRLGSERITLEARRTAWKPPVTISPDVRQETLEPSESVTIPLTQWKTLLDHQLFGLPSEHVGLTSRSLLAFVIRRIVSKSFNEAARTFPQQTIASGGAHVSYFLGLDWALASGYNDLSVREETRKKLKGAANDPVWNRVVGRASELRAEIPVVERRLSELRSEIDSFQVVPEFESFRKQADEFGEQIRTSLDRDEIDRKNLRDIDREIDNHTRETDTPRVAEMYQQLGVVLTDQVRATYAQVQEFHVSVNRNRQYFLAEERTQISERLSDSTKLRDELGNRQAEILGRLRQGGALDALLRLQESYARQESRLQSLRDRYVAAEALEESRTEIAVERARLQTSLRVDLADRARIVDEASILFASYARILYGDERSARLEFDATPNGLRVNPFIASDEGHGVGKMSMFCLDMTMWVLANRSRHGPDFWIHDSHLFDGVDKKQVGRALNLASEICKDEGLQYIATMNSDDLEAPIREFPDLNSRIVEPRLTDEFESGGLFGFRFGRDPLHETDVASA